MYRISDHREGAGRSKRPQLTNKLLITVSGFWVMVLLSVENVDAQPSAPLITKGFEVAVGRSSIDQPIFRQPSGYQQIAIRQTLGTARFTVGYSYFLETVGGGLALSYLKSDVNEFQFSSFDLGPGSTRYGSPSYRLINLDLIVYWLPAQQLPISIYGMLGLAIVTEAYILSGAEFPEWDGQKSITEFSSSYGLGIRLVAIGHFLFFAEYRLIPGDLTSDLGFLYSDGDYNYYEVLNTRTELYTKILSISIGYKF